eukprot:TRINITY_DN9390_c0_g1_i1.p1 TRINITY_DN9390_c0_g1~~TRINITY_DN9390_c0_g1_i1.p1  ORF type:complete len:801 (+),score=48.32 TRINITY_DN9390_c0_g1_i1:260-2662(+)
MRILLATVAFATTIGERTSRLCGLVDLTIVAGGLPVRLIATTLSLSIQQDGILLNPGLTPLENRQYMDAKLVLAPDSYACALNSTVRSSSEILLAVQGRCSVDEKLKSASQAGYAALLLWASSPVPPIARPMACKRCRNGPKDIGNNSPVVLLSSETGRLLHNQLVANADVRILLPDIEPAKCDVSRAPRLQSVEQQLDTVIIVAEIFNASAVRCWFTRRSSNYDPCVVEGSRTASCRSPRANGVLTENGRIHCSLPQIVQQEPTSYMVSLEALYARGLTTTLACFSHQHSNPRLWTSVQGLPIPSAGVPSSGLPVSSACSCQGACDLRVARTSVLWCLTSTSCPAALMISLDNQSTLAIPCDGDLPGLSKSSCAVQCKGVACELDGSCSCAPGWIGTTCMQAVCNPACSEHGRCVLPNVCECDGGYTGYSCSEPVCNNKCTDNGACIAPETCRCYHGYDGEACTPVVESKIDRTSGHTIAIVGLSLLVVAAATTAYLFWRIKKVPPTLIVQPAPEGAALGPIVSRARTTQRTVLGCTRVTQTIEDFFQNESQDLNNRVAGLLPSYRESQDLQHAIVLSSDESETDETVDVSDQDSRAGSRPPSLETSRMLEEIDENIGSADDEPPPSYARLELEMEQLSHSVSSDHSPRRPSLPARRPSTTSRVSRASIASLGRLPPRPRTSLDIASRPSRSAPRPPSSSGQHPASVPTPIPSSANTLPSRPSQHVTPPRRFPRPFSARRPRRVSPAPPPPGALPPLRQPAIERPSIHIPGLAPPVTASRRIPLPPRSSGPAQPSMSSS